MNLVGYLVTMANLQNLGRGPLRDLSVRVADVGTLANEFKAMPLFDVENFKETGFSLVGDIGMYMSNNIVNYITNGNANPKDEGLMILFYYDKNSVKSTSTGVDDGTVALISSKFNSGVREYLDGLKISERNKRSIETSPTGYEQGKLSGAIKNYMDAQNIFGRNQETKTQENLYELQKEIEKEKKILTIDFDKVFKDAQKFVEDQKQMLKLMNNVKK